MNSNFQWFAVMNIYSMHTDDAVSFFSSRGV